jgi:hypothetical protein
MKIQVTYTWSARSSVHPQDSRFAGVCGVQVYPTADDTQYNVVGPVGAVARWLTGATEGEPREAVAALGTARALP